MPSVHVSPKAFEELEQLAAACGTSPGEVIEDLLITKSLLARDAEEWEGRWARLRAEVQARVPKDMTDEDLDREVDLAIQEYREERARASGVA